MLGSSLHSLPLSSLSSPVIHIPSLDREKGSFFSSSFLCTVGLPLTLREVRCSTVDISVSHFPHRPPQFPLCFHLAQIFSFPLNFLFWAQLIPSPVVLLRLYFWQLLEQSSRHQLALTTLKMTHYRSHYPFCVLPSMSLGRFNWKIKCCYAYVTRIRKGEWLKFTTQ